MAQKYNYALYRFGRKMPYTTAKSPATVKRTLKTLIHQSNSAEYTRSLKRDVVIKRLKRAMRK